MKELTVFAQIENTKELRAVPTAFEPGIWRYCLYATGGILPFMEDTFNRNRVKYSNLIINQIEYLEKDDLKQLREYEPTETTGAWYNGGSVIYVRFPFYNPPYLFFQKKYGTLVGFTDGSPMIIDGTMYKSGLLSAPDITVSADAFTYDKMKFNGANVSIDNSDGQFDAAGDFFGNEFNILTAAAPERKEDNRHLIRLIEEVGEEKIVSAESDTDEYVTLIQDEKKEKTSLTLLAQYYVENISVSLDKANFKLNDKRERLSAKIPFKQYTKEDYPDIDDNFIGKDMQEVYGYCFGVPGVCLEGTAVYKDGNSGPTMEQYRFRFSSRISRVDRIQVKMTDGDIPKDKNSPDEGKKKIDGWTTVYDTKQWDKENHWKFGIDKGSIDGDLLAKGEITLATAVAKKKGDVDSDMNEVRMDGVFNNPGKRKFDTQEITPRDLDEEFVTPLDVVLDIMYKYANIPYDKLRYYLPEGEETPEIETELEKLDGYETGVMFDKSVSVYEAVEKLQSGSVLGFQFQLHGNRFTARLDDPNRKPSGEIRDKEILNLNEVEIDWNADLYGSYTDIEYAFNYDEKNGKRLIDKSRSAEILNIHRQEKEWSVTTLLANKEDAELKSGVLLDDFFKLRPIIRNIKLSGEKWFGLRVYDMIEIDFSIRGEEREKYPRHIIRLIEEVGEEKIVSAEADTDEYITLYSDKKNVRGKRDFANKISEGKLLCQILKVALDIRSGVTTIEVRVKGS